jgi:hypothetical protein
VFAELDGALLCTVRRSVAEVDGALLCTVRKPVHFVRFLNRHLHNNFSFTSVFYDNLIFRINCIFKIQLL